MSDALADKRTATRFRVLVEIADRQPAVSQGEIAEAVGVTSQAVSEYIRDLVDDGLVTKEGRSRYSVTKEGVDWLFQEANSLQRYADHVTSDVLGSVQEDTAIATADIEAGQSVTISVREGLLHATPGESGPATGVATTDAAEGTDVSVTSFEGVIEMDAGTVTSSRSRQPARVAVGQSRPASSLSTVRTLTSSPLPASKRLSRCAPSTTNRRSPLQLATWRPPRLLSANTSRLSPQPTPSAESPTRSVRATS